MAKAGAIVRNPVKRGFDVLFAATAMILAAPFWILVPLAIKLDSRGPVFYGQRRSGLGGRAFLAWKFRSMHGGHAGTRQAIKGDPRVTRVGRVLRACALDELPQLWNILRGDMSVVGPRALWPEEVEAAGDRGPLEQVPGFELRSAVRPGLTGIAQIYAPRDLPRRGKFRYDRLYIARQSTWLDVRLVLQSLAITLRGSWERRGRVRRGLR
jgi:lipopolysaccharide/colanic/teichoic acid biosynthesis glycosyltransferase